VAPSNGTAIRLPSPAERLEFTGERFVPGTPGEIEHEHLHRYLFALEFCSGKDVLDVASGEGYGSALLATVARSVIGVELVSEIVEHARRNYPSPNLTFRRGDCVQLPVETGSIDVAVSFETIEHVEGHAEFVAELKRVLRRDGVLVMSSPVRGVYSPGNPNPFHVKELTRAELAELVGRFFHHVAFLGQTPILGSAIIAEGQPPVPPAPGLIYWRGDDGSFAVESGPGPSPYMLIVASDRPLPPLRPGLLQDRPYMGRLLSELQASISQAAAAGAEVKQLDERLGDVERKLAASQASLAEAEQSIAMLEADHREQAARLASEASTARSALEERSALLDRALESIDRLEREVSVLRGRTVLEQLIAPVRKLGGRTRRRLAALQPARLRAFRLNSARKRAVRQLAATGLFDVGFYLSRYRDVAAAGVDPVEHYLVNGAAEGRSPHPMFDTSYYLRQNPDVARSQTNPFLHFVLYGLAEGRRPHPEFSAGQFGAAPTATQTPPAGEVRKPSASLPASIPPTPVVQTPVSRAALRFRPERLSGSEVGTEASPRPTTRTILVTHVLPFPPRAGNEYRLHQLTRWLLSIGHEVHLVVTPPAGDPATVEVVRRAAAHYPNLIVCHRDGRLLYQSERPEVRAMLEGLSNERPRTFPAGSGTGNRIVAIEQAFCPDHLIDLLLRLEQTLKPQVAIAAYIFMGRFLALLGTGVLKVIDTNDVFSTKAEKVVQFGFSDALAVTKDEEATLLRRADLLVAIQPSEEAELRSLAPDRPVVTAGVDFPSFDEVPAPPEPSTILCVASNNPLNLKGIRDFIGLAWPLVRRTVPDARMLVAGPICEVLDPGVAGIELLGRVDTLDDLYARAKVIVNPVVAGTGLKIKTVEALAHLRPIVLWPSGIDGLPPELSGLCRVARNWYEFARLVTRELGTDGLEVSRHREEIHRRLSADFVYGPLGLALEKGLREVSRGGAHDG